MKKHMITLIMAACLLLLPLGALSTGIGDTVWFGRYPYYCNDSAATEPIEWLIVNEQDGCWLLITAHIIDKAPAMVVSEISDFWLPSSQSSRRYPVMLSTWSDAFNRDAFTDEEREMMESAAFILNDQAAQALDVSLRICTPTPYAGNVSYWWTKQQNLSYGIGWTTTIGGMLITGGTKYSAIDMNTGQPVQITAIPTETVEQYGLFACHSFTYVKQGMRPAVWVKIPENR